MKLPYKELEEDHICIMKICRESQKKFLVEILSVSSLALCEECIIAGNYKRSSCEHVSMA